MHYRLPYQPNGSRALCLFAWFILSLFLLVACSGIPGMPGAATPTAELAAPVDPGTSAVAIEGRLVPKQTMQMAFSVGGQVEEVFVADGAEVKKGDLIARLAGKEQLESVAAAAEFELFTAQQALKSLDDDLEQARNLALQELNQARQAVHDAERQISGLGQPASKEDIDLAKTQVVFAKNALDKAQENFDPYKNLPEDNLRRASLQVTLANAQKAYDSAVRKYNNLIGTTNDFDRQQRETDYQIAQGKLNLAMAKHAMLLNGPDPDAVASANARIQAAEARLAAAKADLTKLDLVAAMDGKILNFNIKPGQAVSPGVPVLDIVDFSEWDVETDNLTEIEVVDVELGQKVTVIPDALPDLELTGEVVSISDTFTEKRGEITYTVKIKLDEVDPRLRWGMTVVAEFK